MAGDEQLRTNPEAGEPIPTANGTKRSQARRILEATGFVALWIVIGFAFKLDANEYLFVGLPLTLLFQRYLDRSPLRSLWVRLAPQMKFREVKRTAIAVAGAFAAANVVVLGYFLLRHSWEASAYEVVAVLACIPLAYAIHNFQRRSVRPLLLCFGTAGAIGIGYFALAYAARAALGLSTTVSPGFFASQFLIYFVIYIPSVFLLEEVSFRGAVDSHVFRPGDKNYSVTALYTSILWGLWHLPVTLTVGESANQVIADVVLLVLFQGAVGYFLAIYWRRSGNLLVPGSVHAVIDSVRNGLNLL